MLEFCVGFLNLCLNLDGVERELLVLFMNRLYGVDLQQGLVEASLDGAGWVSQVVDYHAQKQLAHFELSAEACDRGKTYLVKGAHVLQLVDHIQKHGFLRNLVKIVATVVGACHLDYRSVGGTKIAGILNY